MFEQGETATSLYVLLNGCLKFVKVTPDTQQLEIRFVIPGEIYGIARRSTARNVRPLRRRSSIVSRSPGIWPSGKTHTRLEEMATQDVEHRVAHAVLRLVSQSGRKVQESVLVDYFHVARQEIAEVSAQLHSVSRVLSAWENAGLVVVGRKVIVCDIERLPHRRRRCRVALWELTNAKRRTQTWRATSHRSGRP